MPKDSQVLQSLHRPFTYALVDMGIGSYEDPIFYLQLVRILQGDLTIVFAYTGQMSIESAQINQQLGVTSLLKPISVNEILYTMNI